MSNNTIEQKLQELIIEAKQDVFSGNLGDNITTFKGDGMNFREIKEYELGDDIRKINWNATAKTNTTQVNVFDVDRQLNIVVVFLVSGSIHFGSIKFKQDVVASILAHISYSTIKNNNMLSSLFFSDIEEKFIPATTNEAIIYETTKEALSINCLQKQINYNNLCKHINSIINEKSLIFLVGDFYGDLDFSSIAYKHEVYALIVRDKFEEYPYISGEYDFVSAIDNNRSAISMNKDIAKNYQQLLKKSDDKLIEHFIQHRIINGKIYTHDDIFTKLSQILRG